MRILHFAPDEKFTPFSQRVFELAFPGCNEFRVRVANPARVRYVRPGPGVRLVGRRYWFDGSLRADLQHCDMLVVHYMTHWSALSVLKAPGQLPVVWHGWGGDYYDLLPTHPGGLHLPSTAQWLDSQTGFSLRQPLRGLARRLVRGMLRLALGDWKESALQRCDIVSMMPNEFDELSRTRPGLRARFHQLYCSSGEENYLPYSSPIQGEDVLLGNSATPTNNHLDAFDALRTLDLGDRSILVPLSYGDEAYARVVRQRGRELFGDRFVPLDDFLQPEEFERRTARCGYVFMNHVRQQGTGVVTLALLRGAKVFLRPENLLFGFYRDMGVHLSPFPGTPGAEAGSCLTPVDEFRKQENRDIVSRYWSMDHIVSETRRLATLTGSERVH